MEEPFLPWWLILLLVMWAAAITVWQHPSVHREVRLWSGLLALVYLGLIFWALGFVPQIIGSSPSVFGHVRVIDLCLSIFVLVSLISGIWMLGRVSLRGRRHCYIVLTLSNAAFCFFVQGPEIALGLILVAGWVARPLVRKWFQARFRTPRAWLFDLIQFHNISVPPDKSGEIWLAGALCGILACLFLGTIAYALRIETARTTSSLRHTALPSREQLGRIQTRSKDAIEGSAILELATGQRADVVVLLAAIVFVSLSISLKDPRPPKIAIADSQTDRLTENPL